MHELTLFNIGFRCENICQTLKDYEEGNPVNELVLDDSESLIYDCIELKDNMASYFGSNRHDILEFFPLILDVFKGKEFQEIIDELKDIQRVVSEIKKGTQGIQIDKAHDFFNKLSNLCLSRNFLHTSNKTNHLNIVT